VAAGSSTGGFVWEVIGDVIEKGLEGGLAAAEGEELDAVSVKEDLATNKAMGPSCVSEEGVAQDLDVAVFVGAAQIDDATGDGST